MHNLFYKLFMRAKPKSLNATLCFLWVTMNAVKCGGDHSTLKSSLLKEQSYGFVGIVEKKNEHKQSGQICWGGGKAGSAPRATETDSCVSPWGLRAHAVIQEKDWLKTGHITVITPKCDLSSGSASGWLSCGREYRWMSTSCVMWRCVEHTVLVWTCPAAYVSLSSLQLFSVILYTK